MPHPAAPSALVDDLRQLTARELSLPSRLRYVALLLAASATTAIAMALLLTESRLPPRTSIALAAVAAIGVSWVAFAAWVLTRRRLLLGRHRIVAGRMAVAFSALFAIGAVAVGRSTANPSAFAAAAMGGVMLVIAVFLWLRARRQYAHLSKRRDELERLLGRRSS